MTRHYGARMVGTLFPFGPRALSAGRGGPTFMVRGGPTFMVRPPRTCAP